MGFRPPDALIALSKTTDPRIAAEVDSFLDEFFAGVALATPITEDRRISLHLDLTQLPAHQEPLGRTRIRRRYDKKLAHLFERLFLASDEGYIVAWVNAPFSDDLSDIRQCVSGSSAAYVGPDVEIGKPGATDEILFLQVIFRVRFGDCDVDALADTLMRRRTEDIGTEVFVLNKSDPLILHLDTQSTVEVVVSEPSRLSRLREDLGH